MKVSNADPRRFDILGSGPTPLKPELDASAVRLWQKRVGYLSMFAGLTTILASHSQNVFAGETDKAIPPRVKRQAAELMRKINSGACSKPELLRRQSEYRLPGQRAEFNMLEILAGTDNCPGTPIPPGTYTTGAPFTDSGNTTGGNSTVTFVQAGCSDYEQTAGPDHIYSFKISARGANPQIRSSTTSSTYDQSIYVLNGTTGAMCPAGPDADVTNCLVGSDSVFGGATEIITAAEVNSLPLNTQLYLFIDSYYSDARGQGPYNLTIQDVTVPAAVTPPANDAPLDINGDGKSDYVVVRNAGGTGGQLTWRTIFSDGFPANSTAMPTSPTDWGIASDQIVPLDADGDGKDDFAVWRPGTNGVFYIVRSATNTLFTEQFGTTGDDATVVGDYDGDNKDDLAVYRSGATPADPSTWFWRSIGSPPGVQSVQWGQGGDFPAPGDYDGDHKYDFVVQRADSNGVNGRFWIRTAAGVLSSTWFGLKNDVIVPGDYDGDGKTDIAVARDDGGVIRWDFEPSGTAGITVVSDTWGVSATDIITQGDYDGDGKTDYAVWRPGSPGRFFVMTVGTRVIGIQPWGQTGDVPAANYNEH